MSSRVALQSFQDNALCLDWQARHESNVRSYPRKLPLCIARAKGCWLTDVEGRSYLDCLAGAGTLALGHNHPVVIEALRATLDSGAPLHTLDLPTPTKLAFMQRLLALLPNQGQDYCLQFCGPSGADAVEAALKLAKLATGRETVISFSGGFHGMTHGALAVSGNLAPKTGVANLMAGVQFMPYPGNYRCPLGLLGDDSTQALMHYIELFLEDLESGMRPPAAVILEAVQGEGGVNPAPLHWLRHLREITNRHGIALIIDEVQTGVGRTGWMFAFEAADITPDMVVLSKAIGGGLPLAVLAHSKRWDAWAAGGHTGTFRGNLLAMAAGRATLDFMVETGLVSIVRQRGMRLLERLAELQAEFACIGDVRGRGLMLGLEIVDPASKPDARGCLKADPIRAAHLQRGCFNAGLILERGGRGGSVLRLLPPLILNDAEEAHLLMRLRTALEAL